MLREPRDSDDIMRELQTLRKRIERLEQGRRDETQLRDFVSGTNFAGTTFSDINGQYVFVASKSKEGLVYPHGAAAFYNPNSTFTLDNTLASYTTVASADIRNISHDCIYFKTFINTGSTTLNMSWRLVDSNLNQYGNAVTSGPTSNNLYCAWLHPYAVGWSGDTATLAKFHLQVKYNSGAGSGTMGVPTLVQLMNQAFLTPLASSTNMLFIAT